MPKAIRSRIILLLGVNIFSFLVGAGCARLPFFRSKQEANLLVVEKLTFQGNTHFTDAELKAVIGTTERSRLPWKEPEFFNPQVLQEDLKRIRKFYFDRGYLHARVQEPEVVVDEKAHTVRITITIEEGEPTILQAVILEGVDQVKGITETELQPALLLRPGEPLSRLKLEQAKLALLNQVRNLGYARARLETRVKIDEEQRKGWVTFLLKPGEITYFGKTRIEGNQRVKSSFIRRGLGFKEGELFTLDKLYESQRSLFNRGLFERVEVRPQNLDAEGGPVDVLVKVSEGKMRNIKLGIGYGTEDQLRVQGAWTHRNLFGGGQKLTIGGKASFILQEVSASFQQPFFLDPVTDLIGDLSYRQEDQVSFEVTSLSAQTRINRSFSPTSSGFLRYTLQFNEFRNVSPATTEELSTEAAGSTRVALLAFGFQRDTSDDFFYPTRGLVTSAI
ncbi:MAG: hypothetical protein D6736_19125, partial [Nitrospinota bacterium]